MVTRNEDFAAAEYSIGQASTFSCAALVKRLAAILRDFQMRARREQAEAIARRERKHQVEEELRRQTIRRLPLEDLINMGFRHF